MRSKFFVLESIIILFVLLNFNISLSEAVPQPLSTDKASYEAEETVVLNISIDPSEYNSYYLRIIANNNNYTYQGDFNPIMFFYPTEEGIYTIALVEKSTRAIFYSLSFNVSAKEEIGLERLINYNNISLKLNNSSQEFLPPSTGWNNYNAQGAVNQFGLISTDKKEYVIGEEVHVFLGISDNEQVSFYHLFNGTSKKYMGDLTYISFIPEGVGTHQLALRDKNDNIISEYSFEVKPSFDRRGVEIINSRGFAEEVDANILDEKNGVGSFDIPLNKKSLKGLKLSKLQFMKDNVSLNLSLGVDEVTAEKISIIKKHVVKAFAIDSGKLNFTNGTITSLAVGNELWKCRNWDFIMQQCLGIWEKVMDLIPGADYQIEFKSGDPGYAETGLASINTKKPIYYPNETAEIIIVVLDTQGHLVNNADVILTITAPDNTTATLLTSTGEIMETIRGIYETSYSNTALEGNYSLGVRATGNNVNSTMLSYFTVKAYYEFDILRETPVTTDPWREVVNSKIRIISYTNATTFNFTEVLPDSFEITDSGGATITTSNNKTYLTWTNLINTSIINYSTKPLLISPELYEVGPSFVNYNAGTFYEARPWYVAVDPVTTSSDLESGTIQYLGGTQTEFFYDSADSIDATIWNNTNDGDWTSSTANACNGTSFRDNLTGLSYLDSFSSGINTTGYSEIQFRFTPAVNALDANEYLNVSWNDGTGWTLVYKRNTTFGCGAQQSFNLGSSADNNPNFQVRFACIHNEGVGERCTVDDVRLLGKPPEAELNKTPTNYTDISITGLTSPLLNISIIVNVTYYNNSVSAAAGNNASDLDISLYNGSTWINIGKLGITGTGNYSISTTDPTILAAWLTQANRDLSIRGIYLDYMNSTVHDEINYTGVWVKVNYSAPPTVNINTSLDEFFTTNSQPNVDFNFTDDMSSSANCTLYFNNLPYGTNSSAINNTQTNITANSSFGQANYSVYVNCTGYYGSIGKSSTVHIIIDSSAPSVNAISPANGNITNSNRPNFFFNYTDALSPTASCTLFIGSTMYGTNSTTRNNTQTNITANASLSDSTYDWNITCTDLAGNKAGSTSRNITTDTVGPNTTLNQPINFTIITTTTYTLNATANDTVGVHTVTFLYRQNATYTWVTACTNNSGTGPSYTCTWNLAALPDGNAYEIRAYANDTLGNTGPNDTRYNITIDRTGPDAALGNPQNDSVIDVRITGYFYMINASVNDSFSYIDTVTFMYRVNNTDAWKPACRDADHALPYNCSWNLTALNNSNDYQVLVYANDSLGNIGLNDTHINITVYTKFMNITSIIVDDNVDIPINQANLQAGSTQQVYCNFTARDPAVYTNILGANATFYSTTTTYDAADNNRTHYTNSSCTFLTGGGQSADYQCVFNVWHFAINGTWNCTGFAWNSYSTANRTDNTTINQLFALNVSTSVVNYGSLQPNNVSVNVTVNVSNVGNMPMNISVYGFGGNDSALGAGLSMLCQINNISLSFERYSTNDSKDYNSKNPLGSTRQDIGLTIPSKTDYGDLRVNSTYWQFMVPPQNHSFGQCNGSVVFVAQAP